MSRFHKNIIFLDPWLVWEAQWMLNRLAIFSCCLCTLSVKVLWWDSSRGEGGHHTHLLSAWLTLTASLSRVWCLWWQRQSQGLPGRGGARSWLDSSCRCSRVMSRMAGMWKRRVNRWGSVGAKMLSRAMRQYSLASAASQRSSSLQGKGRGGAELWRSGHRIGWAVGSWRERATSQASLASCSVLQVRYLCFKQNKKPHLVAFFFFWSYLTACGILVPWSGTEPGLQQRKHWVLTTGLPGNSWISAVLPGTLFMVTTSPHWQAALGGLEEELLGRRWWFRGFPENGDSYQWGVPLAKIPGSYACRVVTKDAGFYLGRGAA